MSKNNGGAAFPTTHIEDDTFMDELGRGRTIRAARMKGGLTIRDYFAAKALQAIPHIGNGSNLNFDEIASDAYMLADAMLKARNQ